MLLSFCIPSYNNCIATNDLVRQLLSCPDERFEVVVVDDCSTDDTVSKLNMIQDTRLRVICNEANLGFALNWHKALNEGEGIFLYFVIDRDIVNSDKIADLLEKLEDLSESEVAFCYDRKTSGGETEVLRGLPALKRYICLEHPTGNIYRRAAYHEIIDIEALYLKNGTTYPENQVKVRLLEDYPAATINAGVFCNRRNDNWTKVCSSVGAVGKEPFYSVSRRVEQFAEEIKLIEGNPVFHFSREEYDEYAIEKLNDLLKRVTTEIKYWFENPSDAHHYGRRSEYVDTKTLLRNLCETYRGIEEGVFCVAKHTKQFPLMIKRVMLSYAIGLFDQ